MFYIEITVTCISIYQTQLSMCISFIVLDFKHILLYK